MKAIRCLLMLLLTLLTLAPLPTHAAAPATATRGAAGTWTVTARMHAARFNHTATLLLTGAVLVAGGCCDPKTGRRLSSAELYDPRTATWTVTGSMTTGREGHTATRLPDGRVLVAGGIGDAGTLSTAEVYNLSTGRWTPTGSMIGAHAFHAATLLPTGRVLVADRSAELYDPHTGVWTDAGGGGDVNDTATLLPGGQVLVTGGGGEFEGAVPSAEVYDTRAGAWRPAGAMTVPRTAHTATLLLDGRVLIAGGCCDLSGQDACDNKCQPPPYNSAELYDPRTSRWVRTGTMGDARAHHTATLLPDGRVLVVGGIVASNVDPNPNAAELYDPRTGTWAPAGSTGTRHGSHTATLLPTGAVLVAGSNTYQASTGSGAELYTSVLHPHLTLVPLSSRVPTTITLQADGFGALEVVILHWDTPLGQPLGRTTSTEVGGVARITVAVPRGAHGPHRVYAVGQSSQARAVAGFVVR